MKPNQIAKAIGAEEVWTMYQLRLENRRLKRALRKYGKHDHWCFKLKVDRTLQDCVCGLTKALRGGGGEKDEG